MEERSPPSLSPRKKDGATQAGDGSWGGGGSHAPVRQEVPLEQLILSFLRMRSTFIPPQLSPVRETRIPETPQGGLRGVSHASSVERYMRSRMEEQDGGAGWRSRMEEQDGGAG